MNLNSYHDQLFLPDPEDLKREFLQRERDRIDRDALEKAREAEKKAVEAAHSKGRHGSWSSPGMTGRVASEIGSMAFNAELQSVKAESYEKLDRDYSARESELASQARLVEMAQTTDEKLASRALYMLSADRMSGGRLGLNDSHKNRLEEIGKFDGKDNAQLLQNCIDLLKIECDSIRNRSFDIQERARQEHDRREHGPEGDLEYRKQDLEFYRKDSAREMKSLQDDVVKTGGLIGRLTGKHEAAKEALDRFQKERDEKLQKLEKDAHPREFDPSNIQAKIDRTLKKRDGEIKNLEKMLEKEQARQQGRAQGNQTKPVEPSKSAESSRQADQPHLKEPPSSKPVQQEPAKAEAPAQQSGQQKEAPTQNHQAPSKGPAQGHPAQAKQQAAPEPVTASDRVKAEATRVADLSRSQAEQASKVAKGEAANAQGAGQAGKHHARSSENKMTDLDADRQMLRRAREAAQKIINERVAAENRQSKPAESKQGASKQDVGTEKISKAPKPQDVTPSHLKEGPPKVQGFVRDENGAYKKPSEPKPAFVDKGPNVSMEKRPPDLKEIRAAAALCQEKGMKNVKLSGTPEFRRQGWIEGTARGMNMKGYKPTEEDREAARAREAQLQNSEKFRSINERPHHAQVHNQGHVR